jgi:hypothetical protein
MSTTGNIVGVIFLMMCAASLAVAVISIIRQSGNEMVDVTDSEAEMLHLRLSLYHAKLADAATVSSVADHHRHLSEYLADEALRIHDRVARSNDPR